MEFYISPKRAGGEGKRHPLPDQSPVQRRNQQGLNHTLSHKIIKRERKIVVVKTKETHKFSYSVGRIVNSIVEKDPGPLDLRCHVYFSFGSFRFWGF
jgi:hypothetical protein